MPNSRSQLRQQQQLELYREGIMAASSNVSTLEVSSALKRLTVEKTRELFFTLEVPLETLDDIAQQFDGENRKQHFVQKWLNMFPDASWEKLVAGLRKINMNSLATEIEYIHLRRAAVTSRGFVTLETTATAGSVSATPAPAGSVFATPAPADPLTPHENSSSLVTSSFEKRAEEASNKIDQLEKEFSDIKSDARESLSERESRDQKFLSKFRDHLLDLPCIKKQVHVRFFVRNEKEILESDTIQKLFIILGRHCNYTNYEIILHIVKRFCKELIQQMLSYRDSLIVFEKATTVDVYLCAISAPPGGRISAGFMRMTMKMNKPASECTLHEVRELKESIEEEAALESYAVYIDTPETGSVCVRLCIPEEVGWMVGVVLTFDFRQKRLLSKVTVRRYPHWMTKEQSLTEYMNDELRGASGRGDVHAVTSLLYAGVDANAVDQYGCSALMEAAWRGKTEVLSLLVKAGAALDLQNEWGITALIETGRWGRTEATSLLVSAGAALDLKNENGYTTLMLAAGWGNTEAVSLLVKAGAALDLQDEKGHSAVMMATTHQHLSVLKKLVRAGADLNLQNEEGLTTLMISSRSGRTEFTQMLLSGENISVDLQTSTGWSALFFAADKGDRDTVNLLIKAGANPHLTDKDGLTAGTVAIVSGHDEVSQYLSRLTGDTPESLAARITQGVREAVKNTGRWTKQAFLRLETRVLRPHKDKMEQLEAEVRGQEGQVGGGRKMRPILPLEDDVREEYLSRLPQD